MTILSSSLGLLGLVLAVTAASDPQTACENFTLSIPNVQLSRTTHYSLDSLVNVSNAYSSIVASNLPPFCRVELVITTNPAANTSALTEVWLPDDWNGRVLTVGNGGISGGGMWSRTIAPAFGNSA